ncbi:TetR/AcrR family transcriptional regulator [Tateyamaria omphalii]|uniref:TetR/AcrR family transcriptional regulator n=1 Tax=Tateyamaria omphalii TaxID=299262 RepID=UPI001C98FA30|nr:TetR/AcrR family transcriptional regulator [Tateyamaria omphalii]MBY5933512.1 TetR/AcrR family transcriptional regulator [Tateyamaria omphalii]
MLIESSRTFIMNDTKKMGRPRTFDEQEALLAAMNAFWAKGYDGTSMKDLTSAMGISGPSLYSAFGDKRELYLKTIDRYADVDGCAPIVEYESADTIEEAIRRFLTVVVTHSTQQEGAPRGCFLASCVAMTVGEVDGVAERMEKAIRDTDARLAKRFDEEKAKGNLSENFPSEARARLLHDMRQGLVHRSRAGWSAEPLLEDLDDRVRMVLMD